MATRSDALRWLKARYGVVAGPVSTSKYFKPEESWTRTSVWWFQIPVRHIRENKEPYIHLVAQIPHNGHAFHYLRVPATYFREQFTKLGFTNDNTINLHLSAEPGNKFVDERGKGQVSFGLFLIE